MLSLRRMSTPRNTPRHENIDVRAFIETLLAEFEVSAQSRHVTLDALVFSDALELDPTLLWCLLTDLVDDALRRAPTGTHVSLVVSQRGPYTEFRIADEGAGVALEPTDSVFDAGGSREASAAIRRCRSTAEAYGGHLSVAEMNSGTVVCMGFPTLFDARPRFGPAESGTFRQAGQSTANTLRPTILVVDDEPLIRAFVLRALRDVKYNVLTADSAERASALLKAQPIPISLLLSDVGLPGKSGAELVRQTHLSWPGLPTLLMSARDKRSLVRDGVLDADTDLLQKPFTVKDLLAKLSELLTPPASLRGSRTG